MTLAVQSGFVYHQKWLAVLDRLAVANQDLLDNTGALALDAIQHPHRLDCADDLAGRYRVALVKYRFTLATGVPSEHPDDGRRDDERISTWNGGRPLDRDTSCRLRFREIAPHHESGALMLDLELLDVRTVEEPKELAKLIR